MTEVWAFVMVLMQVRVAGLQAAALALVLAGVVLQMWSEGQEIRALLSQPVRAHGQAARAGAPMRAGYRYRMNPPGVPPHGRGY